MWWMLLLWFTLAFLVAIIFGHAARRDEGSEEHVVMVRSGIDKHEVHHRPVLH